MGLFDRNCVCLIVLFDSKLWDKWDTYRALLSRRLKFVEYLTCPIQLYVVYLTNKTIIIAVVGRKQSIPFEWNTRKPIAVSLPCWRHSQSFYFIFHFFILHSVSSLTFDRPSLETFLTFHFWWDFPEIELKEIKVYRSVFSLYTSNNRKLFSMQHCTKSTRYKKVTCFKTCPVLFLFIIIFFFWLETVRELNSIVDVCAHQHFAERENESVSHPLRWWTSLERGGREGR